jgi:hypothetical protein
MRWKLVSLAAAAGVIVGSSVVSPVEAGYVADFETAGAAADFAVLVAGVADTTVNGVSINPGDGSGGADDYLDIFATAASSSGTQMRYNVAPVNFEGAEVAIPTGATSTMPRTEAHLTVTIAEITGADEAPLENPYTQFGFAEFDPGPNTAVYSSKVVVQIHNQLDEIILGYTPNRATPATVLRTFPTPGGFFTPQDTLELQLTETQARVLYNGTPLSADGTGDGYETLPADFFTTNFDANDALIPFFGIFRGVVLDAGDTLSAGFDDINARNVIFDGDIPGDLDTDGDVDGDDFLGYQRGFGSEFDASDLADIRTNFGQTSAAGVAIAIPEPMTASSSIIGIVLGIAVRRSKRQLLHSVGA